MNHQTGQIIAMASYPTFDNRWFSQDISGAKFDELFEIRSDSPGLRRRGPAGVPARPRPGVAHEPGDPGPVQHGLGVQGVRRLVGAAHRADRRRPVHHRQRHVQGASRSRTTSAPPGIKCVWRNSFCSGINGPCRYGPLNMQLSLAVSSDVYYYRLGEQFFVDARDRSRAAAERGPQLRLRGRDRHRPALRVRRPPPRPRDQGRPRRARCARRGRGAAGAPRRRDQPGDRPGPAGRDAASSSPSATALRQRRLRDAAPGRRGDLPAEHADLADAAGVRRPLPGGAPRALRARRPTPIPMDFADPIINGIRQNITGPG